MREGWKTVDLKSVDVNTRKNILALDCKMTDMIICVIHTSETTELVNDVIKSCGQEKDIFNECFMEHLTVHIYIFLYLIRQS